MSGGPVFGEQGSLMPIFYSVLRIASKFFNDFKGGYFGAGMPGATLVNFLYISC
jgi:hypothetical protein